MEWVPEPTPINENRRAQAVEKTGIIGTDQIYLFDIYVEIAKDISGYDAGSFSLYDSKNQCMISEIGKPGPIERHRREDKSASVCSYVLLDKKPLLVFDLTKHETFKYHQAVVAGLVYSYCGFPVINKDGYAMGTFCMLNFSEVKEMSTEKVELIKKPPTKEIVKDDAELIELLNSNSKPKHYIGLEISGFLHLGSLISNGFKINDFIKAGIDCTVFLADWHTLINDKLGGDLETISKVSKYYADAILNNLDVNFIESDLFENVPENNFDLIVANLPYIKC